MLLHSPPIQNRNLFGNPNYYIIYPIQSPLKRYDSFFITQQIRFLLYVPVMAVPNKPLLLLAGHSVMDRVFLPNATVPFMDTNPLRIAPNATELSLFFCIYLAFYPLTILSPSTSTLIT